MVRDAAGPSGAPHADDLTRVRRALAGEPGAVEDLLSRMGCVRRFVVHRNRRLGNPLSSDEVEDTVQDTLFAVWRKLDTYAGRASFATWVYRFTFLEVAAQVRRKVRGPESLEDVEVLDPAAPPEVARSLEYERLYRSLDVVGPPNAVVIRMKHLQALTFEEIGRRLGISVNTAKTQYYRGLKTLREVYTPAGGREEDAP